MSTQDDKNEHDKFMDKIFEGVPDPDDPMFQKNFPICEKKNFDITPANLKSHFLHRAAPLIDDYIDAALGNRNLNSTNDHARFEVWSMLKTIILEAKNPMPLMNIKGKTIDDQVDDILTMATTGKIDLQEAKELISLVQQGYELTELPKMMEKLEALDALGVL